MTLIMLLDVMLHDFYQMLFMIIKNGINQSDFFNNLMTNKH